jgi:hypothetical protein
LLLRNPDHKFRGYPALRQRLFLAEGDVTATR